MLHLLQSYLPVKEIVTEPRWPIKSCAFCSLMCQSKIVFVRVQLTSQSWVEPNLPYKACVGRSYLTSQSWAEPNLPYKACVGRSYLTSQSSLALTPAILVQHRLLKTCLRYTDCDAEVIMQHDCYLCATREHVDTYCDDWNLRLILWFLITTKRVNKDTMWRSH